MGIEVMTNQAVYQPTPVASEPSTSAATAAMNQMSSAGTVTQNAIKGMGSGEGQVKSDTGEAPSEEEIKNAISHANKRARFGHTNAEFSYHEATKRISVKIIDQDTNEVIREIPPEETLDMISKMWELAGIIVDEKR